MKKRRFSFFMCGILCYLSYASSAYAGLAFSYICKGDLGTGKNAVFREIELSKIWNPILQKYEDRISHLKGPDLIEKYYGGTYQGCSMCYLINAEAPVLTAIEQEK